MRMTRDDLINSFGTVPGWDWSLHGGFEADADISEVGHFGVSFLLCIWLLRK